MKEKKKETRGAHVWLKPSTSDRDRFTGHGRKWVLHLQSPSHPQSCIIIHHCTIVAATTGVKHVSPSPLPRLITPPPRMELRPLPPKSPHTGGLSKRAFLAAGSPSSRPESRGKHFLFRKTLRTFGLAEVGLSSVNEVRVHKEASDYHGHETKERWLRYLL